MRSLFLLILIGCFFFSSAVQAAFTPSRQQQRMAAVQQSMARTQAYFQSRAGVYTLKGLEAFTGHKLSRLDKRVFKAVKRMQELNPEDEAAMQRNNRLSTVSMISALAGLVLMFTPVGILSLFLLPAGLITGIIGVSRASRFQSRQGSGFGKALTGVIVGGLGTLLIVLALIVVLSWAWL
ncbi:MAG: hypothetical protein MUF62_10945 [Chitinophagaceae bacterium]|nr:hypothetical protein [Chitinophagaceae bacterium]